MRKADVVCMVDRFDRDPVGALTAALTYTLEIDDPGWEALIRQCNFPPDRTAALHRGDQVALDDLLRDLNELRALPTR